MDKSEYFPRKRLFEEVQELIATFYSTGDYISETTSYYESFLSDGGQEDMFFYCLFLLSMLSNSASLVKQAETIIHNLNFARIKKKVNSIEDFAGEIDVERYIQRNKIEKASPKEYPSIIRHSTYQMPEYQLTFYILKHCEQIYKTVFKMLGDHKKINVFKMAYKLVGDMTKNAHILHKKYGISYDSRETYHSLKKKVIYRYKNRKILSGSFKDLMHTYEKMISFKGIDFSSKYALEIFDNYESFDDRLFEIWLIRQSAELIARRGGLARELIEYKPLIQARRNNSAAVILQFDQYRIEVLFQNRKKIMPKKELKWYWEEADRTEEIGAIPDLIFLKYEPHSEDYTEILLVDAKNRTWNIPNDMQRIKSEVVQQIYIQSNFISIFKHQYSSMLVAHNRQAFQKRIFRHKDETGYTIEAVSLAFDDEGLDDSLREFGDDLCGYLRV